MSENEKKTFEAEEDPYAGAPGLDTDLEWSEEAYYLVLLSKDASEIERRTDIKLEDWQSRMILGYYRAKYDHTTDFYGRVLYKGNVVGMLIGRK